MPDAPCSRRPSAGPVLLTFAGAFALTQIADVALVFLAARAGGGGQVDRLPDQAIAFARSFAGISSVPLVNGLVLVGLSVLAAAPRGARGWPAVRDRLRLAPGAAGRGGLAIAAGMLGLSFATGAVVDLLGLWSGSTMGTMADVFRSPTPARLAVALVAVGVVPGFAEEVFFRGYVLDGLAAPWGEWWAVVGSAALFGLMHVEPVQASVAFLAGVFLGWAARRLGGIRPTIAAHVLNNSAFVALAASGWNPGVSRVQSVVVGVAGALACAAAIAWISRSGRLRASTRAS